jgi:hypothetical protein
MNFTDIFLRILPFLYGHAAYLITNSLHPDDKRRTIRPNIYFHQNIFVPAD